MKNNFCWVFGIFLSLLLKLQAQMPVHDEELNKLYRAMAKNENNMLVEEAQWATYIEADLARIKAITDNLVLGAIDGTLRAAIKDYFTFTRRTLLALDRSTSMIKYHFDKLGMPADKLRSKLFFLKRPRHIAEDLIKKIEQNIELYLDPQNYMPEADRFYLILEALLQVNYYVVEFALTQFNELEGQTPYIQDIFIK